MFAGRGRSQYKRKAEDAREQREWCQVVPRRPLQEIGKVAWRGQEEKGR